MSKRTAHLKQCTICKRHFADLAGHMARAHGVLSQNPKAVASRAYKAAATARANLRRQNNIAKNKEENEAIRQAIIEEEEQEPLLYGSPEGKHETITSIIAALELEQNENAIVIRRLKAIIERSKP